MKPFFILTTALLLCLSACKTVKDKEVQKIVIADLPPIQIMGGSTEKMLSYADPNKYVTYLNEKLTEALKSSGYEVLDFTQENAEKEGVATFRLEMLMINDMEQPGMPEDVPSQDFVFQGSMVATISKPPANTEDNVERVHLDFNLKPTDLHKMTSDSGEIEPIHQVLHVIVTMLQDELETSK